MALTLRKGTRQEFEDAITNSTIVPGDLYYITDGAIELGLTANTTLNLAIGSETIAADYVSKVQTLGTTTATITNVATEFQVEIDTSTRKSKIRCLPDETDLITQTDDEGSESAIYTIDTYAIMERKKYTNGNYISQQLYLEDGKTRPQYDYKQGPPNVDNVKEIAFTEDLTAINNKIGDMTTLQSSYDNLVEAYNSLVARMDANGLV